MTASTESARRRSGLPIVTLFFLIQICLPEAVRAAEENVNRPGGDYSFYAPPSPDASLCEAACRNNSNLLCKAFTYVKPSPANPNGVCWLKDRIPDPVPDPCCTSAVVRETVCVHGNSGQFEDAKASRWRGWGIDFDVAGTGSWLHYSIPIRESVARVEGIWLTFTDGNPNYGWISALHVYDAGVRVAQFDNQVYGRSIGTQQPTLVDVLVPLVPPISIAQGIGVSLLPQTETVQGLAKIVNFQIHRVCALVAVP